jgi:DNA-binding MarR family transcriptional regulator
MKAVAKVAPRAARSADDSYVLEDQVGHLLRRAHQRHGSIFQEVIGHAHLTPLQFAALVKLGEAGELSQNHLGRLTAMDAATMQGVIKRLIVRRLIERRPDPLDRRRLLLRLTAAGETLTDTALLFGPEISARTLAPLTATERSVFLALLRRLA